MKNLLMIAFTLLISLPLASQSFKSDDSKTYAMPTLAETPDGKLYMTWIEKDDKGMASFCMSFSDAGTQNFTSKINIISGYGVSSNKLFPAKLLSKKNGELVAILMYNPNAKPGGGRGGFLAYQTSKDMGKTWTEPMAVDSDPSPGLRGFYDAIVLPNDEVAVAYLKDVKNSTKHEERDLRIAITKNGVFQVEKLIDAVVCDCCNISLLIDNKGFLNIYYRDNNEDVRDIAHRVSKDNGLTFSDSKIIYADHWYIQGCPHNGASSISMGDQNLITWYSAGDNEPGVRLVKENGEKLMILSETSAKNSGIAANSNEAVFYWLEFNKELEKDMMAYALINGNGVSEKKWIDSKVEVKNASAKLINGQLLVAFESDSQTIRLIKDKP